MQLAKNWIELYADDSYKIKLLTVEESEKIKKNLPNNVKIALAEFSDKLNLSEDEQIRVIKEICEKHDIKPKEFFEGAYTILLGKNKGPRLIPFINSLNKGKVKELLS